MTEREQRIVAFLQRNGASFFQPLHDSTGGGYPGETLEALWSLVWRGLLTNDALHALRAYCEKPAGAGRNARPARRVHNQSSFRSRRTTPPTAQGRWSLNDVAFDPTRNGSAAGQTAWSHAIAQQLLTRYGVVFRETAHAENLPGGFSAVYDVLKALEESGRVRRGYFAADLGATQFAMPAAVDLLRSLRITQQEQSEVVMLAATDPANPYGALLRWPAAPEEGSSLTRSVGARVVLVDGALTAYMRRGNPNMQVLLPEEEPQRSQTARALAEFLVQHVQRGENPEGRGRTSMLITQVNGVPCRRTSAGAIPARCWLPGRSTRFQRAAQSSFASRSRCRSEARCLRATQFTVRPAPFRKLSEARLSLRLKRAWQSLRA